MLARLSILKRLVAYLACAAVVGSCASGVRQAPGAPVVADPLSAWNDTAERRAILDYVARVTRPGSPEFIPREHRLATLDFDGTLGCEKPDYMEVVVAAHRLCELTEDDPKLLDEPLYRAACDDDLETLDARVEEVLLTAFLGESQSFYVEYVEDFLATQRHPRFDKPYGKLYYVPMLELIDLLRAHDFTVYIVSGSQQGFTRSYGEQVLGLAPAHLVGHAVALDFSMTDGAPTLQRQDAFRDPAIGGEGKVEVIRQRIGRYPVLAVGNSMGDFEMLQSTAGSGYLGLAMILVHDDPDEYVYRDQTLIDHAEQLGWQTLSMRDNFKEIFPD